MPISDFGSHVIVGEEIKSHWAAVNADRVAGGGTALVLADGYSLTTLTTDVTIAEAAISGQEGLDNGITISTTNRDNRKVAIRDRVIAFREVVPYRMKGSGYALALPDTPAPAASEQKFLRALDDMEDLWRRINADTTIPNFTPPLLLRGNYAFAAFQAELALLRTVYRTVVDAENAARMGRTQRDLLLPRLRDRYVQYRQAIMIEYGAEHPFATSLPVVYAQSSGSAAEPVELTGVWNPVTGKAEFSWPASTDPNLSHYQMRVSVGSSWDADTATVIGNIPAGSTTFGTTESLENPGDKISCKLFVILTTGNEAGSNTVTITRT